MYSKNGVMTQEQIESAMSDELDEVDQWLDDGMFVFYCNDEHWMDCDGNVVTS